ncbi:putative transcription factor interactor and regulator CCHC(Zn) family [Helianthus annuus]|uniref:Putative ARID DNA-binding domain-containing protein n=1 Tax=Helianthus annuus TaxID=4232 RepID=A0A251VEX7_HELAN|nr:putative transcription factor interactor and regulator CCHC(Zn) family [Helianthus annuus]
MPANKFVSSAAHVHTTADGDDTSVGQHSGIRAMFATRSDAEIKPTATTIPCQHCFEEKNERKQRSRRVRLCYYCHLPGHQIYTCKSKENDEESQLIRQAINAGTRTQNDEVHCREEMIVTGTDGGQWKDFWYVNPTFNHHFVDGGYREVTTENIWPIIAKDLGFEYKDGDYMRITYAMYLDVLEYYYKFKSVQEAVHVKQMVNEGAEFSGDAYRKTCSEGTNQNEQADNVHAGVDATQFALFAGN